MVGNISGEIQNFVAIRQRICNKEVYFREELWAYHLYHISYI
jgi:hypothetical protein